MPGYFPVPNQQIEYKSAANLHYSVFTREQNFLLLCEARCPPHTHHWLTTPPTSDPQMDTYKSNQVGTSGISQKVGSEALQCHGCCPTCRNDHILKRRKESGAWIRRDGNTQLSFCLHSFMNNKREKQQPPKNAREVTWGFIKGNYL